MGLGWKGLWCINFNDLEFKYKGLVSIYVLLSSIMVYLSKFDMLEFWLKFEVKDFGLELGWIVDGGVNFSMVYIVGKSEDKEKLKLKGKGKEKEKFLSRVEVEL